MSEISQEMTFIRLDAHGTPEVLKPARMPVPAPGPGEVLIKVAAAGVNRPDVMQRKGQYPPPPDASDVPGLEIAGEIVAVGDDVPAERLGQKACALVASGGYAAYCVAPDVLCLPVPGPLDMVAAAALPETYFTVWTNVFERGGLKAGETILIHGGSSGIGTTAIQLAKAFGATVFTTVGTEEKAAAVRSLGADLAVNYRREDFVEAVRTATGGKGVDLILDMVGADYLARNMKSCAVDGRLVMIGFMGGIKIEVDLRAIIQKRLHVTGSTLRPRSIAEKAAIADGLKASVWPLLEAGKVAPLIHTTFPLEEAAAAHRLMEASDHIGKIMLVP